MADSNQGKRLTVEKEVTYGTDPASSPYDFKGKWEMQPVYSDSVQADVNFSNAYENEPPIRFDKGQEGILTLTAGIRMAETAGQNSQLVDLFTAGGWTHDAGTSATTIAVYTDAGSFTLTDDEGAVGRAILVELDNGDLVPRLLADYSSGTNTCTLAMDLPSAASAGNAVYPMHTVYPGLQAEVGDSLAFNEITRALNEGGSNLTVDYCRGTQMASIADTTIESNIAPEIAFTMNAALAGDTNTAALGANDFQDGEKQKVVHCLLLEHSTSDASGGITSAAHVISKSTIMWGATSTPLRGTGGADCISDFYGAMMVAGAPMVEIEEPYDNQKNIDWEGTNPYHYIGIVQKSSAATQPAYGWFFPKANLVDKPQRDKEGDNHQKGIYKYRGQPAGYSSDTLPSEAGNQSIYFCWSKNPTP